jgi:FMN-dependent NADH-azoreductase
MPTLLHLNVSPRGDDSTSRRAGPSCASNWPRITAADRDRTRSGAEPLPPIDAAFTDANWPWRPATADPRAGAVRNADRRTRSGRHGADHHADAQLHGAGIAEDVDRPGRAAERTFAGTPQGKQGLLRDRPVLAVVSCGGGSRTTRQPADFFTPYLKYVLERLGCRASKFCAWKA